MMNNADSDPMYALDQLEMPLEIKNLLRLHHSAELKNLRFDIKFRVKDDRIVFEYSSQDRSIMFGKEGKIEQTGDIRHLRYLLSFLVNEAGVDPGHIYLFDLLHNQQGIERYLMPLKRIKPAEPEVKEASDDDPFIFSRDSDLVQDNGVQEPAPPPMEDKARFAMGHTGPAPLKTVSPIPRRSPPVRMVPKKTVTSIMPRKENEKAHSFASTNIPVSEPNISTPAPVQNTEPPAIDKAQAPVPHYLYPFTKTNREETVENPFYKQLMGYIRTWEKRHASLNHKGKITNTTDAIRLEKFCEELHTIPAYRAVTPLMLQGFVPLPPSVYRTDFVAACADLLIDQPAEQKGFRAAGIRYFERVRGIDLITAYECKKVDFSTVLKVLRTNATMTQEQLAYFCGLSKEAIHAYEHNLCQPLPHALSALGNALLPEGKPRQNYMNLLIELSDRQYSFLTKPAADLTLTELIQNFRFIANLGYRQMAEKINVHPSVYSAWETGALIPSQSSLKKFLPACGEPGVKLLLKKRLELLLERDGVRLPDEQLKLHQMIRKYRILSGLQQWEMAEKLGLDKVVYGRWETGVTTVPEGDGLENFLQKCPRLNDSIRSAFKKKKSEAMVEKEHLGEADEALEFHQLFKKIQVASGLTQDEIKDKIGIGIEAWVQGISVPSAEDLARFLDVCLAAPGVKDSKALRVLAEDKRQVASHAHVLHLQGLDVPDAELASHRAVSKLRIQTGYSAPEVTDLIHSDLFKLERGARPFSVISLGRVLQFCSDQIEDSIATRSKPFLIDQLALFYAKDKKELRTQGHEEIKALYREALHTHIDAIKKQWIDEKVRKDGVEQGTQNLSSPALWEALAKSMQQARLG